MPHTARSPADLLSCAARGGAVPTPRRLALPLALVSLGLASTSSRAQEKPPEKPTGFIGIQMDAVAVEGTPARSAVRVLALVPGSPAVAVGLKPGDLLTALDGEELLVPPEQAVTVFRERLKPRGPGDKVRLTVL